MAASRKRSTNAIRYPAKFIGRVLFGVLGLQTGYAAEAGPARTARADSLWPAARQHVRIIDGQAMRFTSKLANLVELNFTMNNGHQPGKRIISESLTRIAAHYGGIKVKKFATQADGSVRGIVPDFTIDDLLAGEVIVANNISGMGDTAIGRARQSAIQTAIETHGRGYLAFHGSGENSSNGWAWFINTLHPMRFTGHENRSSAPVYKHLAESGHVVLEGILEANTTPATVPNELDGSGNEVLAQSIPTRLMKNEWFHWDRDISRDSAYQDKVTVLLKYDAGTLGIYEFDPFYRRRGGNLFTYLYRVGAGMTSYVQPGHENDELLDSRTGLDGGVGDYDRYVAQSLFYLAGYRQEPCDSACTGLPVVDARSHLTGGRYGDAVRANRGRRGIPDLRFTSGRPGFTLAPEHPAVAELVTPVGQVIRRMEGRGPWVHEFKAEELDPGVYILRVRVAGRLAGSCIYAVGK